MSPSSTKLTFPGVQPNPDGTIDFTLTDEEAHEADLALKQFEGYVVHPDCAERIRNGAIAVALSHYARKLVVSFEDEITRANGNPPESLRSLIAKAIASVWKSYSLYPLPVFTFHRASFFRFLGDEDEAQRLFSLYVKQNAAFKPDQVDEHVLRYDGFDVQDAFRHARQ